MNHICITFHPADADFASAAGQTISQNLHLDAQMIGPPPDGEADWVRRLDAAIGDALALVVILSPEALAARHVTFGWFAAQQLRKPIIPVLVRPLPDLLLLEDIPRLDFVDEDPWEALIARVWDAALSVLLTRLWHADPAVRLAAIEALGELGDRRAAWPLTERLRDTDPDVQMAAIEVLGVMKDEGCIPALMMLMDDENPAIADAARAALSTFPPEKTGLSG